MYVVPIGNFSRAQILPSTIQRMRKRL